MSLISGLVTPRIFEYIDAGTIACVVEHLADEALAVLGQAATGGSVLCLEVDGFTSSDCAAQLETVREHFSAAGGKCLGETSNLVEAQSLWRVRQEVSPACFQRGSYKLADDLCIPRNSLLDFDRGLKEIAVKHKVTWLNYGHIGDADFHPTLMFEGPEDPQLSAGLAALREACELAVQLHGSISGEHGIGSLKAEYLRLQIGAKEADLMHKIKAAFDPRGILCPGKWL